MRIVCVSPVILVMVFLSTRASGRQAPGQSCVPGSTKDNQLCRASEQDPVYKKTPKSQIRVECGLVSGGHACCFNVYSGEGIKSGLLPVDATTLVEQCQKTKNPCCQDKGAICDRVYDFPACCFSAAHPNTGSCDPQYEQSVKGSKKGYTGCCDDSKCVSGKCVKK